MEILLELLRIAALCGLGFVLGGTFADIDLAPPLPVRHRSAWTHGLLVPAALWYMVEQPGDNLFWFTVGFLPAYSLHLLADMFPKRWHGSAFISMYPLPATLGAALSFTWLLAGVVASGYLFYLLLPIVKLTLFPG